MLQIGNIALNLSVATYLLYFLPQLLHNNKNNTRHMSWGLHILYIGGMCADTVYGFGNHLALQYKLVSITGLVCLTAQHMQLLRSKDNKLSMTLLALLLVCLATIPLLFGIRLSHAQYNIIGMASQFCWWTAFIPQIIKNYRTKNSDALSSIFIALTISCSILDLVAAICLHWPYPSIISPPIMIALHAICWAQKKIYNKGRRAQIEPQAISAC